MAKLRLLGGPAEEIACIVIEAPSEERRREEQAWQLRQEAKRLHEIWLANPTRENRWAFAAGLKVYGEFVDDRDAVAHAFKVEAME